jgi:hypothetical protein
MQENDLAKKLPTYLRKLTRTIGRILIEWESGFCFITKTIMIDNSGNIYRAEKIKEFKKWD